MSDVILKPCPFCGGELKYSFLLGTSECDSCGVMIGFPKLTRHEDKIVATNTRKPIDDVIERLKERSAYHRRYGDSMGYTFAGYEGAIDIVEQLKTHECG